MASRYLEPRLERASRADMRRRQARRLREQVTHAARRSPFYRRKLRAAGVDPARIRTLDDLARLPFTTKDELKDDQAAHPPWGSVLAEAAARKGIDLAKAAKLRITWHTGEPGASIPATKEKIETAFGARAYDLPGLTEIAAWGFECDARAGLTHVHEDYVYPEVLDEADRPVKPGERGELVFTSLYRKAMPLLRYRTRDIVHLADRRCPCGRTLIAFEGGVHARLDDMKKVRGVIVYPRRVEELVRPHANVDEFQIVFRRVDGLDDILVRLDPSPALARGERDGLRETLAKDLQLGLGIRVSVEVGDPGCLPRWDHKARRVKDERTEVPF